MDFSITDRMKEVLAEARALMENEVYSIEAKLASKSFAELLPELAAVRAKVKAKGLWRSRRHRGHAALPSLPPRARRSHLRRSGRGAQGERGQAHPA